jgi:protoporphyrinogen oxidase
MAERIGDHIVIGAGISGLGAAHFAARRGIESVVLEAAPRIGGCIHSHEFDGLGGFWAEAGSHTCFNSYGNLLAILDDLGLTTRVRAKAKVGYRLWLQGERRSVMSALHPVEALVSLPRLLTTAKAGRSVADYYGRVLGSRNYRDLLRHAFQAVICQPADEYPAEALFRRKPRRKDVIKAFTFDRGLSTIAEAVASQPSIEVRTGQRVEGVEAKGEGFRVSVAGSDALHCRTLTLAVPPDQAARLLPGGFENVRAVASAIGMAEIETLALAFRASDLELPPLAGLIAVDDAFYSAVTRDFLPDSRYRGCAFHFRPASLSPQDQIERACAALGAVPERIAAQAWVTNRLPALRAGHAALVERLDRGLAGRRLGVTGNWFLGVSIEDALTRSRAEMVRLFGS